MTDFNSLQLPAALIKALDALKITTPTPVQREAIPHALEGKDVLASARTGSGKTIAYLLPMIVGITQGAHKKALILVPTRELALQIQQALRQLLTGGPRIEHVLLIGGESMFKQLNALRRNPQVIVGTPGRIYDHLQRRSLTLNDASFLVLDETDRM